jgi:hypothetical protein
MATASENGTTTLATYAYDSLSRRTSLTYGNGATMAYTYSNAGDLATLNHDMWGNANDPQFSNTFTPAHQLASRTISDTDYRWQPTVTGTDSYTHNDLNQYTTVAWCGGSATSVGHDTNGNLTTDGAPAYLFRDNDGAYGGVFRRGVHAMGIRDRLTTPHSPWQNGHVERLIGSIRRECVGHFLVLGERHLRRVLSDYAAYYNNSRTHLALAKDSPGRRAVQWHRSVVRRHVLGGLHHCYGRTTQARRLPAMNAGH